MKVRTLTAQVVLGLVLVATPSAFSQKQGQEPPPTSLVAVLANPSGYADRRIQTYGFLDMTFMEASLFLNQDDAIHHVYKNSIALDFSLEEIKRYFKLNHQVVLIDGTFSATGANRDIYSGLLMKVTRVEAK